MKHILIPMAFLAAFTLSPSDTQAAVIGTYDFDYTDTGNRGGQGRDQNGAGVLITDDGTTFRDSFDFSNLAGATIDSFGLTITFSGAGPLAGGFLENWNIFVEGADPNSQSDDLFATLSDANSPLSGTIDATTAPGNSFFDDAVAALGFDFSFGENSLLAGNSFRLAGMSLTVNGTAAVVPLPAPGLLLLVALGGLGLMRRRGLGQSIELSSNTA